MKTEDLTQSFCLLGALSESPTVSPISGLTALVPGTPDPSSHPQDNVFLLLCFATCSSPGPPLLPCSSPGGSLFVFQDMWLTCHHLEVLLHPSAGRLTPCAPLANIPLCDHWSFTSMVPTGQETSQGQSYLVLGFLKT